MLPLNSLVADCLIAFIPFNLLLYILFSWNTLYASALCCAGRILCWGFQGHPGELNHPQMERNQMALLLFTPHAGFVPIGKRR